MPFILILGYPNPRKGAFKRGGLGAYRGGLSPILPYIMRYVNSGVLNSGKSKNDLHFDFRVPEPLQGRPREGVGGPKGGYHQISCVMSILGFSMVGNPKMTFISILGYPNPHKGALKGGGLGGLQGGLSPILPYIMW